jgi:hypothetical protein
VGLIVDLGSVASVRKVRVDVRGSGTDLQVRSAGPTASAAPPRTSENDYQVVCTKRAVRTAAVCVPRSAVRTRYLLIWLTKLPAVPGGYRGSIEEVKVLR